MARSLEAFHFPSTYSISNVFMFKMLMKKNDARITTCMKILYFTINNNCSINKFEREFQSLRVSSTLEMFMNDEYGSYITRKLHCNIMGFIIAFEANFTI